MSHRRSGGGRPVRYGAFDANYRCVELQDDAYDYIDPGSPWTPVGAAAELHGLGLLLVALAVLLLPRVLGGRRPGRMLTLAAIVVSAGVAVAALPTLLSGLAGEVVSLPHVWLSAILYLLGLSALLIASAAHSTPAPLRVWRARWAVAICLIVANNVVVIHLLVAPTIFVYSSYDTTHGQRRSAVCFSSVQPLPSG